MINKEQLINRIEDDLNIDEVKEILGISEVSIYRLNNKGELLPNYKWRGKNYWKCVGLVDFCIQKGMIEKVELEVVNE